ncbi:hypothetical protein [Prescottella agglutinans]|uniref:Secreted protein n=1 Tax=Prescottella agglutinans TaxID=1644129 RepID=A0ABT6MI69_9NOCA|nr:hypothetical protein [Prescottella agglutinans]MDH6284010.1 hypothetical protein [Prescottella agglutinans]
MTTSLVIAMSLATVAAVLVRAAAATVAIAHRDAKRRRDALATLRVLHRVRR